MKTLKKAISVRGDHLYCPLPLSLDSYWNCLNDCHHCYLRAMNHTWGDDLRPADPDAVHRQLANALKNKNPRSHIAQLLKLKKTIRFGNKTDPFQKAELEHRVSRGMLEVLIDLDWTFVIQTMDTAVLSEYEDLLREAHARGLVTIMPIISPGFERDWVTLERQRTNSPAERVKHLKHWIKAGIPCGVNGEPFIPGFHTVKEFKRTIRMLKEAGVESYNTYNLHLNPHVAKRFHSIGLDIEKIWTMNQDEHWRPILRQLMEAADQVGIRLGCPDFVNTGWGWKEEANTCCGINVPNPSYWNTHHWKRRAQDSGEGSEAPRRLIRCTWEGAGSYEEGCAIIEGTTKDMYTLKDIK
jgi:DNA repair photolyase